MILGSSLTDQRDSRSERWFWVLEASISSWGFWQAKAEFPPQTKSFEATKVVLGTAILWRDEPTGHTGLVKSSLLLASTSEVPSSHAGM